MTAPIIKLKESINRQKPCAVAGCPEPRYRVSSCCKYHWTKNTYFGHPLGERVNRSELDCARHSITTIINRNQTHSGVNAAIHFIDTILSTPHLHQHPELIVRLGDVKPLTVLIEVCSMFHHGQTSRKVKSDRNLMYLVGMKFLRIRPTGDYVMKGGDFRDIGQRVYDGVGVFMLTMSRAVDAQEAKQQTELKAMTSPLEI